MSGTMIGNPNSPCNERYQTHPLVTTPPMDGNVKSVLFILSSKFLNKKIKKFIKRSLALPPMTMPPHPSKKK